MLRTSEEIVSHIKEHQGQIFDFAAEVLAPYLPFEYAQLVVDDLTEEEWCAPDEKGRTLPLSLDRTTILREMRHYMEFAIGKATGHRGLSASRSVSKFKAWDWLLGDEEIDAGYENYGAPTLKAICERYSFDLPPHNHENGAEEWCERCMFDRMAAGEPCMDACEEGCGL